MSVNFAAVLRSLGMLGKIGPWHEAPYPFVPVDPDALKSRTKFADRYPGGSHQSSREKLRRLRQKAGVA